MFRYLLVFLFLFVSVYCQNNCQPEIDKFHDCLKKSFEDQQNAMKEKQQDRENKMKDNVQKCFTSNGCKQANFDNAQGVGPGKGQGKGDFEKRHQCAKQVSDKARGNVEQCVQKTQPDFHFPAPQGNKGKQGGGGDHEHGDRHGGFGNMDKIINDSCPDNSRQAVKTCMRDSWKNQAGNQDEMRQQFQQNFNKTCQARDTCLKAMSPACQTQYNATKQTICDCAQKLDKTQLENEYNTCVGTTGSSSTGGSGGPGSSAGGSDGRGRFGHRFGGGSPVDSFIKKMCNNRDFCHGGFHGDGGLGDHRFGWQQGHGHGHGPRQSS